MINVALITSWGPGCGTSEYAKNVMQYCIDEDICITKEVRSLRDFVSVGSGGAYDIVHVNESGFVMAGFEQRHLDQLKNSGKKVLLTVCNPNPRNNRNPFTASFDKVIVFEPNTDDGFEYVPLGAPVYDVIGKFASPVDDRKWLGTNGFPQERKNLLALAEACTHTGYSLMAFIPRSPHADSDRIAREIYSRNPSCYTELTWQSPQHIAEKLSQCEAAIYPYIEWMPGASSATMFGVSARVPLIVSRASQFDFLFKREEEVYFIESARPTVDDIVKGIVKAEEDNFHRSTAKLYEEHRWDNVGARHAQIYKEMIQ